MKIFVFILISIFVLSSCVKDPNDISPLEMFKIHVNDKEFNEASFIADNRIKYKISMEALDGIDIDDDKQVTISVSDGTVASISNLAPSSSSTQISVSMQGGKGVFYYIPGRKAHSTALMSISIQGLSQLLTYTIKPSEPTQIILGSNIQTPKTSDNLELTAYLINKNTTSSQVSDELKVFFETSKSNPSDTIEAYISAPSYSLSAYNEQSGLVTAKTNITTNKKPGSINVIAKYTNANGILVDTSMVIVFKP